MNKLNRLGFGVDIKGLENEGKVPFAESFDALQRNSFEKFINPFINVKLAMDRIFKPNELTPSDHLKVLDTFAQSVIDQRRKAIAAGEEHKDLLSRFMNTTNAINEPLDDVELRDTIMNFIIAGRDTTAQALSWTFLMLMSHPRVEQKLVQEIKESITDELESNSPALYEAIKEMNYAHAV